MLKHKGRERREEKRRENRREEGPCAGALGFLSLDSLSRSCSSGGPKDAGPGGAPTKEGAEPQVWITSRSLPGRACVESHTGNGK